MLCLIRIATLRQEKGHVALVATSVTGKERQRVPIDDIAFLICDFIGAVENPLNFDCRVAKRVIVKTRSVRTKEFEVPPRASNSIYIDSGDPWKPVPKRVGTRKGTQNQLAVAHNPGPQSDGTAGAAPRG